MLFVPVYLCLLFIAPQLWIGPLMGIRVDLILYPAWLLWLAATGRTMEIVRFRAQDWFFVAFLVWLVVTTVANHFASFSVQILVFYTKWFVLYRFVVASHASLAHVRRTLLMLLGIGVILAIEGISHMHSDSGLGWAGQEFAWMDERAEAAGIKGRTRWVNIFDGPGVFCVVYTMTLPLALQYLGKPFGAGMRLWGTFLVGLLLLATYYTGSRGGFLATLGVIGLYFLTKFKISPGKLILVGLLGLMAFALGPAHLTSTRDSHGSAQKRIDMWGEGIEMTEDNPLFGIGRGRFASYTGTLIAHNSPLEIMGEMGLPGLFLWLGIAYMGFKGLRAAWLVTEDPRMRSYLVALGLSVAGYMLSGLFVTLEYETWYFLLALMAATAARAAPEPVRFEKRDFYLLSGTVIAFFVAIKSTVMIYY